MIHGAHVIIYSKDADADRAFIRDVLRFSHVDVGGGWLIFGLPPAEVAVHPTDGGGSHELYLMCDDIEKFRAEMAGHGVPTGGLQEEDWGVLTEVLLPSGAKLGVYEPRHARPEPMPGAPAAARAKRGATAANAGAKRPPALATPASAPAKATPASARAKPPTTRAKPAVAKAVAKRPVAKARAKPAVAKAVAKRPVAKASAKRPVGKARAKR